MKELGPPPAFRNAPFRDGGTAMHLAEPPMAEATGTPYRRRAQPVK
jgi:hypothetical protein